MEWVCFPESIEPVVMTIDTSEYLFVSPSNFAISTNTLNMYLLFTSLSLDRNYARTVSLMFWLVT